MSLKKQKTKNRNQIFAFVLAANLYVITTSAQTTSTQANSKVNTNSNVGSSVMTQPQAVSEPRKLSLSLALEYSSQIAKDENGSRSTGTDLAINPLYKFNDRYTGSIISVLSRANDGQNQTLVSDTQVGLAIKGYSFSPGLKSVHSIATALPTSEKSKKEDRLNGSIALTNGLQYGADIFQISYKLGLAKNFHEFDFNSSGSANIEYKISQTLEANVSISEKIKLTGIGIYRLGRTYGGKERTAFEIHSDVSFDLSDKMSLNLGTSNVGNALKANGVDSNVSAYNENTSIVRAGFSILL